MRRSLVLKKERLAELSTVELTVVNGGASATCPILSGDCAGVSGPCMATYRYDCILSNVMANCPTQPTFLCD